MTSDEVLTALRCCASDNCDGCPLWDDDPEDTTCADGLMAAAADLIKFQQQGLEALTKLDEESRPKIYRALDALAQLIKEKAGEAV